ncbi:MAG TPA: DUF5131 family protein [Kofleriaceae bacterium]
MVGGLAVGAWGVPRATKDVDLYAELPTAVRPRVRRELMQRNFDVPAMDEELQRFGVFRSLFRPTSVFVDIFDAENPLGEAILNRRREVQVQGRIRWTAAAEDLAVLKAFSDRARDLFCLGWNVIVGGESGAGARPLDKQWVRSLRDQCAAAKVPFFFKQWGGFQKGKHGRHLDGRTYDEMPTISARSVPGSAERTQRIVSLGEFAAAWKNVQFGAPRLGSRAVS